MYLRAAVEADLPALVEVFESAFDNSVLGVHCFPSTAPDVHDSHVALVKGYLPNVLVAVTTITTGNNSPYDRIIGWACWLHRDKAIAPVFTNDHFPASGDQDLARRYFQTNVDMAEKIIAGQEHWSLSMLVVHRDAQRQGIGSTLLAHGLERADATGCMVYLNSSVFGKELYERFGFRTVEVSNFEHGITSWHMKRDAASSTTTVGV